MSQTPPPERELSAAAAEELLQGLRRKEGNWLQWGQALQQLHRAGHSPQVLFEDTGFEPIHQNQLAVAAQVFATLEGLSDAARAYLAPSGSEIVYELRQLDRERRVPAAELVAAKQLDIARTRDLVRAVKDFSRRSHPPDGFGTTPGEALAYQCWKLARGQKDLQARSRLIAQGFQFAETAGARAQLESLLSDFTVVPGRRAPLLPGARLESEEELPVLLPVVEFAAGARAIASCPSVAPEGAFNLMAISGGRWTALPGWQSLLNADDPVAVLASTEDLPEPPPGAPEPVLVVVDRAVTEWSPDAYFLCGEEVLGLQWFEEAPGEPLLGRVLFVLRRKKVIDETAIAATWDLDE